MGSGDSGRALTADERLAAVRARLEADPDPAVRSAAAGTVAAMRGRALSNGLLVRVLEAYEADVLRERGESRPEAFGSWAARGGD